MLQFMTRLGRAAIVLAITGSTVACATVTRGTKESWTVRTEPPGAAVKTSTGMSCEATPCTFDKLKRNVDFDVALTKAGYKTVQTRVTHAVAGAGATAFVGNVLIGGVIGAGVDASTGATMDLKPNPLIVTLETEIQPSSPVAAPAAP
ncbi:MAG TPA: translation initiation factor 2 [Caulobacteraceae bacterium]|nr:translation initiation factor 2 [Caulobacteraceae bacterium]